MAETSETTEEFCGRLTHAMTEALMSMSIAVGLESGLFRTLVKYHETPMTAQDIADHAGLKERYVRDWLGVMVCSDIVHVDAASERYHLPSHRVPAFEDNRASSMEGHMFRFLPMLTGIFSMLLNCMKKDGPSGIPYSMYSDFHALQGTFSATRVHKKLCESIVASLPSLKEALANGIRVLEVGCGEGALICRFAELHPNSTFVGSDISEKCMETGREAANGLKLANIKFVQADSAAMPLDWTTSFDYVIIFDVVHDVPRPDLLLQEVKRVLKPGGMLSIFEPALRSNHADNVGNPVATDMYAYSLFHCLPVSAYFEGSWRLGTGWGKERALQMFNDLGITVKEVLKTPACCDVNHFWCTI